MMRICQSLANAGFDIQLIGRELKNSPALTACPYQQKRLKCFFHKGKAFYLEYNIRLLFFLLFKSADCICAIDLDTILPCLLISKLKGIERVYDAHEYFSQQKEIISRPAIYRIWHWIEKKTIPRFKHGYTVSQSIAEDFEKKYGVQYSIIRNLPEKKTNTYNLPRENIILYQGAVNEARGLEYLIPAMKSIDAPLHIYGDGNFMQATIDLIKENDLSEKLLLMGKHLPKELDAITQRAKIGINLVENIGLNQYYSLANKFFDYIQFETPQISMNFPEYKRINDQYEVAILLDELNETSIANAIQLLLNDSNLYERLKSNCTLAKKYLNWEEEEKILIQFYKQLLG